MPLKRRKEINSGKIVAWGGFEWASGVRRLAWSLWSWRGRGRFWRSPGFLQKWPAEKCRAFASEEGDNVFSRSRDERSERGNRAVPEWVDPPRIALHAGNTGMLFQTLITWSHISRYGYFRTSDYVSILNSKAHTQRSNNVMYYYWFKNNHAITTQARINTQTVAEWRGTWILSSIRLL